MTPSYLNIFFWKQFESSSFFNWPRQPAVGTIFGTLEKGMKVFVEKPSDFLFALAPDNLASSSDASSQTVSLLESFIYRERSCFRIFAELRT